MSPKAVRGIVTLVSVLIFAVVSGVVFFFGPHGGFSGYLEKEPFDSVNYFWGRHHRTLIFGNVGETDHAVWVELENVRVEIEETVPGTMLSASPSFWPRAVGEWAYYDAASIVVLVQDDGAKQAWENYLNKAVKESEKPPSKKTQPRHIVP